MIKKTMQKLNRKSGKKGFTVVELCVVLALVAMLTTMFVSFTVLMKGFANESESKYEFLKDSATIERELRDWAETQETFTIDENGVLSVGEKAVSFSNGTLTLDDNVKITSLDTVTGVTFDSNETETTKATLIKCTVKGSRLETTFVIYPRTAVIEGGANES